jgi:hypothetical protein
MQAATPVTVVLRAVFVSHDGVTAERGFEFL